MLELVKLRLIREGYAPAMMLANEHARLRIQECKLPRWGAPGARKRHAVGALLLRRQRRRLIVHGPVGTRACKKLSWRRWLNRRPGKVSDRQCDEA